MAFFKNTPVENTTDKPKTNEPRKPLNKSAFFGKAVAVVIVAIVFLYVVFQLVTFLSQVTTNWKEIEFAYAKPSIVRAVRSDYEKQQGKLDTSFVSPKQDSTQKLLQQISDTLKQSPK